MSYYMIAIPVMLVMAAIFLYIEKFEKENS